MDDTPCTATFTPPSADEPLPCALAPHPITPFHESAPVGYPGRPWAWRDGAPGSTLPAARLAEAWELEEGDVIDYRSSRLTVEEIIRDGAGVEIRTVSGPRIIVEAQRQFFARRA